MRGVSMNENRIVLQGTNKRDALGFLLFVFLLPYVCACLWGHVGEEKDILDGQAQTGAEDYRVGIMMEWGVWELSIEEYLVYKLECVMPASYEEEALKAQAVLLRTELFQVFREQGGSRLEIEGDGLEKWYYAKGQQEEMEAFCQAVEDTQGVYLCYDGEPIQASYFKVSNGQTRDAGEVWHTKKSPYLSGVPCEQDKSAPDYSSQVVVSKVNYLYEVRARIGEQYDAQDLWDGLRFTYDGAGYVTDVLFYVGEEEVGEIDGETFRYIFGLPSASFRMEQEGAQIVFYVTGVGHGFGMSQYGANSRALNGMDYPEILKEFFPGTELAKFE